VKRKNRRLIGFTLAAMLLVLTACSNQAGNNTQPPDQSSGGSNTSSPPSSSEASETNGMNADGKYDPPITLTTVRPQENTVKFTDGDSMENNVWTRAYEEKYGIKVKTLWSVDPSQYAQKMNLTIVSGEIPDFFRATATQFKQLVDAGLLADLTEVYDKYATDSVKDLLTEEGNLALESATIDGKLMGIPFTAPSREGAHALYIRADWLKKLNLPEPKTMEDVYKISEAFTTQDPDQNGKQDTYGLAVDKDFILLTGFFNSFHAYPGNFASNLVNFFLKDSSGNITSGTIQPEVKAALGKLQELFKAKQIDPEFGAKDITKVYEMISNGKVGMMYGPYYTPLFPLQGGKDKDPAMEWKAFPIFSVDATPPKSQTALGVDGYWVVKKGVEHPEAILKMLDFWNETFYKNTSDEIQNKFNSSEDGNQVWLLNNIAAYKAYKNVDASRKIIEALGSKDTSKLNAEDKGVYEKIIKFQQGDLTNWGWAQIFSKGGTMSISDYYRQNDLYITDEFTTAPLDSMIEKQPVLTKLHAETFTKIILGLASVDEFDNFTKQWLELGGSEVLTDVNEWYKSKK